jgi:hypothetical protein
LIIFEDVATRRGGQLFQPLLDLFVQAALCHRSSSVWRIVKRVSISKAGA